MKSVLIPVALMAAMIVMMCGAALAQSTAAADPGLQAQPPRIAPGSVIPVELTRTIDAKKAKTGDEVVAKVMQDIKTTGGEMIVAKDTKIVGHVTEAKSSTKEQKESEVGIAFDRALTKGGETKLPMSIQAIIAPPSNTSAEGGSMSPSGPVTGGGTATSPMSGRSPLSPTTPQPQAIPPGGIDAQGGANARPPINASTQGVIGIPDLKLETNAQNATQGSVISSEKGNVKLESGTFLLLRVGQ